MIVIVTLVLLVPALIGVLLYERFKGCELILRKRLELLFVFAFFINLIGYASMWLRGWEFLSWASEGGSSATIVSFMVQYMLLSLVTAVVIAYVMSLVRVEKTKGRSRKGDGEQNGADEISSEDGDQIALPESEEGNTESGEGGGTAETEAGGEADG